MAEGGHGKWIAWITAGAAVVGAFVALYGILHHPDTSVADYQRQVRATCGRVHDLLTTDHGGEIIDFDSAGGFPSNPLDLVQGLPEDHQHGRSERCRGNDLERGERHSRRRRGAHDQRWGTAQ